MGCNLVVARSMLQCMTQCSFHNPECQSGTFESSYQVCQLYDSIVDQLEDGENKETIYFMKLSPMISKYFIK